MNILYSHRWLVGVMCAVHVAAATAEPDPPKPHVAVGFEIEAASFARLPDQGAARTELARLVAPEFALRYPFADWLSSSAPASGQIGTPIGRLVARLVQTPGVPLDNVMVKWFGSLGDGGLVELPIAPVEIYSSGVADREANNKRAFVSHVAQRVMPVVQSDGFHQQFMKFVVRGLSIASTAELLTADRAVVIPRMWRDLRLGQETKLMLVYSKPAASGVEEGRLKLRLPIQRPTQPKLGWLQAGIEEASIGTSPLALQHGWHDRFQTLLEGATVRCLILEYHPMPFAETVGSVSLASN